MLGNKNCVLSCLIYENTCCTKENIPCLCRCVAQSHLHRGIEDVILLSGNAYCVIHVILGYPQLHMTHYSVKLYLFMISIVHSKAQLVQENFHVLCLVQG